MIIYSLYPVSFLIIFHFYGDHHCQWEIAKCRPIPDTYNGWAGRDLISPCLLWNGASVLVSHSWDHSNFVYDKQGVLRTCSNPYPHRTFLLNRLLGATRMPSPIIKSIFLDYIISSKYTTRNNHSGICLILKIY